ncbi:hypothetical protein, partial [uncultured Desulfovibrio sp.]|uniref:hypothetical protein n=1 Tax=uncultured Desulfovibrio sp. TaxID=167968 RepID=UPI0026396848
GRRCAAASRFTFFKGETPLCKNYAPVQKMDRWNIRVFKNFPVACPSPGTDRGDMLLVLYIILKCMYI